MNSHRRLAATAAIVTAPFLGACAPPPEPLDPLAACLAERSALEAAIAQAQAAGTSWQDYFVGTPVWFVVTGTSAWRINTAAVPAALCAAF